MRVPPKEQQAVLIEYSEALIEYEPELHLLAMDLWPHPKSHGSLPRLEEGVKDVKDVEYIVATRVAEICLVIVNGSN